ncbi:MAG: hypothetical protein EHM35_17820 [Planctomycetaceae bacterium]|nr:MAG: hypothetical protein EHM35_17820 [Planctomycetaceae bacterium]
MRDRVFISIGLLLFLVLVTFPMWQGIAAKSSTRGPDIKAAAGQKSCVAPTSYMRVAHMDLLMDWRDGKVREQQRRYTAFDGKVYDVNLTSTCLTQCHGSKDDFCDRCHVYAGVPAPDCWGCHTSPPAASKATAAGTAGGTR